MSVAVLVLATGREDYLSRTLTSAAENLHGPITERWIYTETAGVGHPGYTRIGDDGPRRGIAGAVADAWRILLHRSTAQWVLHLEEDFTFRRQVDVAAIVQVLQVRPYLVQMALRRQPWNADEHRAGGVVEQHPDDYTEMTDGEHVWLEHRRFFTTNPCVYRRSLMQRGWPHHGSGWLAGAQAEGQFGVDLFATDGTLRAGFWGARDSGVWVDHIGAVGSSGR